jgi:hypothetical protein
MKCVLKPLVILLAFSMPAQAKDPILRALERAALDVQAGRSAEQVVDGTIKGMRGSGVSTPRNLVVTSGPWYDGTRVTAADALNYGDDLTRNVFSRSGFGMYYPSVDGKPPNIDISWPHIIPFDPDNPCHQGIMTRARNGVLEEVVHALDDRIGQKAALQYTPAYKEFLERTGKEFDSEVFAHAFMEEHMGIRPEANEIVRYGDRRAEYYRLRNPDLIPGKGAGTIPSRPAPGPDFFRPSDKGIDLLGDSDCVQRLKKLEKVGDAVPPGGTKVGRLGRLGSGLKGGGGKLLRGGGRVLAVGGGVAGGIGAVNLADASMKGGALGYAEVKAVQQRNKLMWDLYHDPVYAGDPLYDRSRTGGIATQGANPKLRSVIVRLSDSLWGNIELGPSVVDIVP